RVAVTTHPRALDVRAVFRLDRERIVHRIGDNLFILEWSKQLRRIADREIPRDPSLEKFREWHFVFNDSMTRHAANAISRQGSVDIRLRVVIVSRVNQLRIEITLTSMFVIQPAFSHHAVTLEAGVVDGLDILRHLRRIVFEETLDESN